MRYFFLLYIIFISYSFSVDIEALKKEKEIFKLHKGKKYIKEDENRIIIIFKEKYNFMNQLEKDYNLHLEKCLVKRVCIFKNDNNITVDKLIEKIDYNINNIIEIKNYKKYQFKRY